MSYIISNFYVTAAGQSGRARPEIVTPGWAGHLLAVGSGRSDGGPLGSWAGSHASGRLVDRLVLITGSVSSSCRVRRVHTIKIFRTTIGLRTAITVCMGLHQM